MLGPEPSTFHGSRIRFAKPFTVGGLPINMRDGVKREFAFIALVRWLPSQFLFAIFVFLILPLHLFPSLLLPLILTEPLLIEASLRDSKEGK